MKNTLVDAGPLIALFDKSDQFHTIAVAFLKGFRGKLLTTWPVVTETSFYIYRNIRNQFLTNVFIH